MRYMTRFIVMAAFAAGSQFVLEGSAVDRPPGDAANGGYRDFLKCGPNSLFLFLILTGKPNITLEELQNLPASSEGTSLQTLRDAAGRFGVSAEIRRYDYEDVGSMPLPAIGQFKSGPSSLTPYHFSIIYKVDSDRVHVLDGTTGGRSWILRQRLPHFWTGIAMTETRVIRTPMGEKVILGSAVLLSIINAAFLGSFFAGSRESGREFVSRHLNSGESNIAKCN